MFRGAMDGALRGGGVVGGRARLLRRAAGDRRRGQAAAPRAHGHSHGGGAQHAHAHGGGGERHGHAHGGHGHSHGGGHGHSHGLGVELGGEYSPEEQRAAAVVTWAGVHTNVALSVAKVVGGAHLGSMGLLADAVHSASDLLTDFVTLVAVRLCARPPDERFPFGYGRWETVCTAVIGALIVWGALGIASHALAAAVPALAAYLPHAHHGPAAAAGPIAPAAAGIAAASIVVKEALYQWTARVGERLRSGVLTANAWHHRTDAATSVLALAGIVGANLGAPALDSVAAIVTSVVLIRLGWDVTSSAVCELADAGLPEATTASVAAAAGSVADVAAVDAVRGRTAGRVVQVELRVRVAPDASLRDARVAASAVQDAVRGVLGTAEVLVETFPDDGEAVVATEVQLAAASP